MAIKNLKLKTMEKYIKYAKVKDMRPAKGGQAWLSLVMQKWRRG